MDHNENVSGPKRDSSKTSEILDLNRTVRNPPPAAFFEPRPRFRVAMASAQGYLKNPLKNGQGHLQTVALRGGQERSMHAETIAMQVFHEDSSGLM